jgi:hypothetical protein
VNTSALGFYSAFLFIDDEKRVRELLGQCNGLPLARIAILTERTSMRLRFSSSQLRNPTGAPGSIISAQTADGTMI